MDKIEISGIRVDTIIGVYDWEQRIKQRLDIDLELGVDLTAAASSDDLECAIDYQAVTEYVIEFCDAQHFKLIEALAHHLAEELLASFPLKALRIKLSKPGALNAAKSVAVILTRSR